MNKTVKYTFISQEWALPVWLLMLIAGLLGMTNFLVFKFMGQESAEKYSSILLGVMIGALTVFYKKIYQCPVEVNVFKDSLVVTTQKLVGKKELSYSFTEISECGVGFMAGAKFIFSIPDKHWAYFKVGKKSIYLFNITDAQQPQSLVNQIRKSNPNVVFVKDILKQK